MANANDPMAMLYENLVDAGCNSDDIECYMNMAGDDNWGSMIPKLKGYRTKLLDHIHENQNRLECLDFLIYKIGKANENNEKKEEVGT